MYDPGGSRSSPRLPVFGNVARVVLWEGSLLLERLVVICSVFWGIDDPGFKNLEEWYRRIIYTVRIAINRFFLRNGWIRIYHARRWELEGQTDIRSDRKSGAVGCRGVSWSEKLDGKELRGALSGERYQ